MLYNMFQYKNVYLSAKSLIQAESSHEHKNMYIVEARCYAV